MFGDLQTWMAERCSEGSFEYDNAGPNQQVIIVQITYMPRERLAEDAPHKLRGQGRSFRAFHLAAVCWPH